MRVISFSKLRLFFEKDPNSRVALQDWYKKATKADWEDFSDLKKTFNSADFVGNSRFVFNVKGNHYRIIARILFKVKIIYVRWVGNHREYDKLKNIDKL